MYIGLHVKYRLFIGLHVHTGYSSVFMYIPVIHWSSCKVPVIHRSSCKVPVIHRSSCKVPVIHRSSCKYRLFIGLLVKNRSFIGLHVKYRLFIGLRLKYRLFLSDFNETNFLDRFSKNISISNLMKIPPVEQQLNTVGMTFNCIGYTMIVRWTVGYTVTVR
jgi:hypothetical protein